MTEPKKIHAWPLVLLGALQWLFPAEQQPGTQKAVVELSLLVIGIGLAYLAGQLIKKNKNLVQDDKPTTLATRGSYVPVIKGRRRIGFVFTYAGQRAKRKEKAKQGGKGNVLTPKVDVFTEDGMHVLCVGPAYALWEIEQGGTPIFVGPITSDSHPSGSTIDLGSEGSFRIFWGERDQPPNTYLGHADRIGIESRWPRFCYIEWRAKRLGQNPVWPQITYVIETRPTESPLTETDGYIEPTDTVDPDYSPFPVTARVTGAPGTAYFQVAGHHEGAPFRPLQKVQLSGNTGLGTVDYEILKVETVGSDTRVFPSTTVAVGATADGSLIAYVREKDDGWNGGHMIAEWLFGAHPIGLGLDQSEWDMEEFEVLADTLGPDNEDLRCSSMAVEGQDAESLLGALMQDFGLMLPLNMRTGLLQPYLVRQPVGTLVEVTEDALLQKPEIKSSGFANRSSDRLIFQFSDEENFFRDMTIGVDDDGQVSKQDFFRAKTVQIIATSHFATAAHMTERRSFEELGGAGRNRISVGRSARTLLPGWPLLVAGFNEIQRVESTSHDPLSGNVTVTMIPDIYGAPLSDFVTGQADTGGLGQVVVADPISAMIEVPEALTGAGGPQTLVPLAVRAHSAVLSHNVHISRDGSTFSFYGNDLTVCAGGTLLDALPDAALDDFGLYELDQGPTFTALGPDISTVLDLSADTTSWRNGRQLCVLIDASGQQEVCFLKKVTNVSGDTYRLDGLIRARYDTRKLDLSVGAEVYILQNDDGLAVQDPLLEPEVTLYSKSEPVGVGGVSLASITADEIPLYGKGIRPVPVSDVRLDAEQSGLWVANAYVAAGSAPSDDLVFVWAYSTPQSPSTGAGMFPAGSPVFDVTPEGSFLVEILDSMDNVVRQDSTATASYTYLRADRLADFSASEPASFKIRVTQVRDGYSADPVTTTITNNT